MNDERPLVLVTGGSGLLGRRLIDRLHDRYRVVSLDLQCDPLSPPDVEFVCIDVTSDESVHRAVDRIASVHGATVASVVHLAAYYDFAGRPSPLYEAVTVEGTRRVLRALQRLDVGQFVFSSTLLVHESTEPGEPIDADAPIDANWAYPESKVETEQVVAEERDGTRSVVLRIAGGYDEMGHSPPITNQIKRIHGKSITSRFYPADPSRGQPFVHIDDAVSALEATVERRHDLPDHLELVIGEPDTVGYGELQDLIAHDLYGQDWATWHIPAPLAKVGAWLREQNPFGEDPFIRSWMVDRASDHYELDISRARETIGWEPEHRLRDVVHEMVDNVKADPVGWYEENDLTPPRSVGG